MKEVYNEKGVTYPIVLFISLIAFLVIFEILSIYLSELGYMIELQLHYERKIKELLEK